MKHSEIYSTRRIFVTSSFSNQINRFIGFFGLEPFEALPVLSTVHAFRKLQGRSRTMATEVTFCSRTSSTLTENTKIGKVAT